MRCPDMHSAHGKARILSGSVLVLALAVGGCSSSGGGSSAGSTIGNLITYGSTTEPPIRQKVEVEATDCPQVGVMSGRASIRHGSSQVSISEIARECMERPDGSIVVKVGVQGLVLSGSGGVGRSSVPVAFQITQGGRVIASRSRSGVVSGAPGDSQGTFSVVEGGMIVPAKSGHFDIDVGLGGGRSR